MKKNHTAILWNEVEICDSHEQGIEIQQVLVLREIEQPHIKSVTSYQNTHYVTT